MKHLLVFLVLASGFAATAQAEEDCTALLSVGKHPDIIRMSSGAAARSLFEQMTVEPKELSKGLLTKEIALVNGGLIIRAARVMAESFDPSDINSITHVEPGFFAQVLLNREICKAAECFSNQNEDFVVQFDVRRNNNPDQLRREDAKLVIQSLNLPGSMGSTTASYASKAADANGIFLSWSRHFDSYYRDLADKDGLGNFYFKIPYNPTYQPPNFTIINNVDVTVNNNAQTFWGDLKKAFHGFFNPIRY